MLNSLVTQYLLLYFIATASCLISRQEASSRALIHEDVIPSTVATGDVNALFISSANCLDGPKLSGINASSYDWWYFDVVAPDLNTSIAVVFYTASQPAFPFLPVSDNITTVGIYITSADGSIYEHYLNATEATITSYGQGSSGVFNGAGAKWEGTPDLSYYTVRINSKDVSGTLVLKSVAPGHYPCGPIGPNQQMNLGDNVGWANAIPDANGIVDFTVDGQSVAFEGVGYHDKNWSPQPFQNSALSWYWGHARVGPYSLVWFDYLDVTSTEHVSLYLSKDKKIISSSCSDGSVTVRPWGGDDTYPPKVESGRPDGFGIEADLGDGRKASFNVTIAALVANGRSFYSRWTGSVKASFEEECYEDGSAVFEQFKLAE